MIDELPKTETELQELIDAKVKEATENLTTKHNGEMATMRKRHDEELRKAKEQAGLTAEQIAEQKIREQQEQDAQELAELRQFKKTSVLSEKLKAAGLPDFFKNDTRLLNAEDGNVDKVIKDIKKEFEATQPKGNTFSSVVQTATGSNTAQQNSKEAIYEETGNAIKNALGNN